MLCPGLYHAAKEENWCGSHPGHVAVKVIGGVDIAEKCQLTHKIHQSRSYWANYLELTGLLRGKSSRKLCFDHGLPCFAVQSEGLPAFFARERLRARPRPKKPKKPKPRRNLCLWLRIWEYRFSWFSWNPKGVVALGRTWDVYQQHLIKRQKNWLRIISIWSYLMGEARFVSVSHSYLGLFIRAWCQMLLSTPRWAWIVASKICKLCKVCWIEDWRLKISGKLLQSRIEDWRLKIEALKKNSSIQDWRLKIWIEEVFFRASIFNLQSSIQQTLQSLQSWSVARFLWELHEV